MPPAQQHAPASESWSPPVDNHVHTEWSWDAPREASMVRSCEQALAAGLPGVAFTDHLDFTTWTDGDQIGAENLDPHRYARMHLLDLAGYLAALDDCRQRYPDLRILSGVEIGEAHLWAASAARDGGRGRRRPDPRLAARDPVRRAADGRRRPVPADAGRRRDAPVLRRTAAAGRGQRHLPGAGAPRLPPADVAAGGRAVRGAGLRGGVPGRAAGPGRQRPGPRGEHQEPAGLGRTAAAGGGRPGAGRSRSAATRTSPGGSATSSSWRWTWSRRPVSGPGATASTSGAGKRRC